MNKLTKTLTIIIIIFFSGYIGMFICNRNKEENNVFPSITIKKEKPLDKYTFDNLSNVDIKKGIIERKTPISNSNQSFKSYLFTFTHDPDLDGKNSKTTTGQINIPDKEGVFPIILMFRGYVDQELYKTGDGTKKAASVFAENDYITIAPDFLGYADSDNEASDIFESRFQTYTTSLSLIKSLDQIDKWDNSNIFVWGHSNGGQIAISLLEISKLGYPTTLWAPVSKPFPYSILFYTDESEDRGKYIRKKLSEFEEDYDVEKYSITNYLNNISAPLQIHQGAQDDAVPIDWSNDFVNILNKLEKEVMYYKYSATDHNLLPNWNLVISRDMEFFNTYLY